MSEAQFIIKFIIEIIIFRETILKLFLQLIVIMESGKQYWSADTKNLTSGSK